MNIIERAYQLAPESGSVEEVKRKLMREGYLNVHSHLSGHQIRHDLLKRLNPQLVTYRKARAGSLASQRLTLRSRDHSSIGWPLRSSAASWTAAASSSA